MWVFLFSFREYCSPDNTNNVGRNNGCQESGSSIADKTISWQSWPWFRRIKWLPLVGQQWWCRPNDRQDSNPLIPCSAQSIWEKGCRNKKTLFKLSIKGADQVGCLERLYAQCVYYSVDAEDTCSSLGLTESFMWLLYIHPSPWRWNSWKKETRHENAQNKNNYPLLCLTPT